MFPPDDVRPSQRLKAGPVSVLTFDTFQQPTEGEAERLKPGPPKT
jgi:hypothetical protein